jgi:hypothetical protein
MLINIENTTEQSIGKLKEFAKQHQLKLSFIDDNDTNYWLPGKPLTEKELTALIERSRASGVISMKDAHNLIRQSKNAD